MVLFLTHKASPAYLFRYMRGTKGNGIVAFMQLAFMSFCWKVFVLVII